VFLVTHVVVIDALYGNLYYSQRSGEVVFPKKTMHVRQYGGFIHGAT
jgi:hypothetical protein